MTKKYKIPTLTCFCFTNGTKDFSSVTTTAKVFYIVVGVISECLVPKTLAGP